MEKVTVSITVDIEVADPEEFERQLPNRMDSVLSAIRQKMPSGGVEVTCEYESKETEESEDSEETQTTDKEESTEDESPEETSEQTEDETENSEDTSATE